MIGVYDKIIPSGYSNQIEEDLRRSKFPWNYIHDVTNKNYGNNSGFVHMAYDFGAQPSDWHPFIQPIVYSIMEATGHDLHKLLRIRIGLLTKTADQSYEHNTPHVDFLMPHYTACYYASDSDGDTVVFNQRLRDMQSNEISEPVVQNYVQNTNFTVESRCSPKKGRVCVFDGLQFHASTKPKLHETRLVITVNYITKEQNESQYQ